MLEFLSLIFILIAAIELFVGYKIISRSDPFTFLSLISIRLIFDYVLRPFTFVFIEDYVPGVSGINRGLIHQADAPFYALMTIILNDLVFLFVLLGAYVFIKNKEISEKNTKEEPKNIYLIIGIVVFVIGLINWFWVIQAYGGLLNVLVSLGTGRQNLFSIGGSKIPLELAKNFLAGGIFLMTSVFFFKRKVVLAWLLIALLFFLLLSFGGRGIAVAAIISGLIAHNYFYRKINLKFLIILFIISIPLLTGLRDVRRLLDGETEIGDIDFSNINNITSYEQRFIEISYVSSAFDYDMGFHYSFFENRKDYFLGEYILGLGMVLPRSFFPDKGSTLANKLAQKQWCDGKAGCLMDVGISPSMVTSTAAYWSYLFIPFIGFFIGYFGMYFWYKTVHEIGSPISIMSFALGYPYAMTLFQDLGAFLLAFLPIFLVVIFSYVLIKFPYKFFFIKSTAPTN